VKAETIIVKSKVKSKKSIVFKAGSKALSAQARFYF
jgi:hypothetical protein